VETYYTKRVRGSEYMVWNVASKNYFCQFSSTAYSSSIHIKIYAIHTIYYAYPLNAKVSNAKKRLIHIICAERIPWGNWSLLGKWRN
jgi:hypothetical protein